MQEVTSLFSTTDCSIPTIEVDYEVDEKWPNQPWRFRYTNIQPSPAHLPGVLNCPDAHLSTKIFARDAVWGGRVVVKLTERVDSALRPDILKAVREGAWAVLGEAIHVGKQPKQVHFEQHLAVRVVSQVLDNAEKLTGFPREKPVCFLATSGDTKISEQIRNAAVFERHAIADVFLSQQVV